MAESDYQAKPIDSRSVFLTTLASEGVKFLLSHEREVPVESLNEKIICLFFSANWCRPCKAFTPQLVQLYSTLRKQGEELEIIFISLDNDETGLTEHFRSMPWIAVPFNLSLCKKLRGKYKVDRIPSLVPLFPDCEVLVDEDVVGLIEDYGPEAFPFTRKRREELKGIDDAKRLGGKLEKLLTHEARNHVVSRDGGKVLVSELVGMTIGLYFGAHWSPPCRSFTSQLREAYNELKVTAESRFEVILVSADRDAEEFNTNMSHMPWLAIPYEDRMRQDLCRIFGIKAIPALVFIGPEGKTINTDGKAVVSLYGARGFPFTESMVAEIEAGLKKEGDGLPRQVKDEKHEHLLKLDMAKAYVCDFCKKQGKFWAFSCKVCDYDLHPTCLDETS